MKDKRGGERVRDRGVMAVVPLGEVPQDEEEMEAVETWVKRVLCPEEPLKMEHHA